MKIRKILFPLSGPKAFLTQKWWHRLFIVIFSILILIILLSSLGILNEELEKNENNIYIYNNLREFSKNSDPATTNTVPSFLAQKGQVGCLDNNILRDISTYYLEEKSVCSSDVLKNIKQIAARLNEIHNTNYSTDTYEEGLKNTTETRYCFISADVNCSSDKIIMYKKSNIYYLTVVGYSLGITYLASLLLQLIYFKGFIYIVYGKNK